MSPSWDPSCVILIIVLVVVVFWRGPSTLPKLGEALGKAVKGARDNMPGAADDAADQESAGESTDGSSRTGS